MIYCLFEQSGTFRDAFRRVGFAAECIDIRNDFEKTDHVIDIFQALKDRTFPFDSDTLHDKTTRFFAFFPCTYFSSNNDMIFRGDSAIFRKMSEPDKERYILKRRIQRNYYKTMLYTLVRRCIVYHIPLILENPASQTIKQYLGNPTVSHSRNKYGDYFYKPTCYYFYFCSFNERSMKLQQLYKPKRIQYLKGGNRTVKRSMISQEYADNFIKSILW